MALYPISVSDRTEPWEAPDEPPSERPCGECRWWVQLTHRGAREVAELAGAATEGVEMPLASWEEAQAAVGRDALVWLGVCARRTEPRMAQSADCEEWEEWT